MSNIVHKIKDALTGDHTSSTSTANSTTHHASGAQTTGTGIGAAGAGYNSGVPEGTAGPHSSRIANTVDPRVDSDLDRRGAGYGNTATTGTGAAYSNTAAGLGHTHTRGSGPEAAGNGPHTSNVANILDPRVDSTTGANTIGSNTRSGATYGTTGTGAYNTTAGPHDSNLANKLDPRVDSTTGQHTIGSKTHGTTNYGNTSTGTTGQYTTGAIGDTGNTSTGTTGQYTTGTTGGISNSTNAGPHNSNIANKLDPRVDSDLDGRRLVAGGTHATPGSGSAQNTAGPHNSDLSNKLDPRVDSDLDNSSTLGANRTYATGKAKDPLDAASVPPSVMREHIGDPQILHNNPGHNHQGRHGSVSDQEKHRGL